MGWKGSVQGGCEGKLRGRAQPLTLERGTYIAACETKLTGESLTLEGGRLIEGNCDAKLRGTPTPEGGTEKEGTCDRKLSDTLGAGNEVGGVCEAGLRGSGETLTLEGDRVVIESPWGTDRADSGVGVKGR